MIPHHPTHNEIAKLAYSYWKESGEPDGHDLEHWFKAESELKSQHHHHPRHNHEQEEVS